MIERVIETLMDGDRWCAREYGFNIQEGTCGFGETEKEAIIDFANNLP